jgi:hypothetical protein
MWIDETLEEIMDVVKKTRSIRKANMLLHY